MINTRALAIAMVGLIVAGRSVSAEDLSRYREYVLGSSIDVVAAASGARAADAVTLHERPARIQELEWRAPYSSAGSDLTDPVHHIVFGFCEDQLYKVVVSYNRARTEGLTDDDIVESLSALYGVSAPERTGAAWNASSADTPGGTLVVARWESAASLLTLLRRSYSPEYQLVLISKELSLRARTATREAVRLDTVEAPQREMELRQKAIADADAARQRARDTNKSVFRP